MGPGKRAMIHQPCDAGVPTDDISDAKIVVSTYDMVSNDRCEMFR